ncbi:MAG TPA: UvrD-helicase domain-containing protein, partial [Ilumatobacteraceae bacterium]
MRPGPDELARGLVVTAGSTIATPWADAERFVIDDTVLDDPEPMLVDLMDRAAARKRVVVELSVPFTKRPWSATDREPYEIGARFWFALDVLHHVVWSNAIDATGAEPHWDLLDRALALGATAVADPDATGDIVLADGTKSWLDGGPPRRSDPIDGLAVIPAVSVEHGSLRAPRSATTAAELADDQRAAVVHAGAAARIIAPAGSGKTRVLTERARHLLNEWRVPPTALSLVAFNKRAQEEMQSRTTDLRGLRARTLNAIALAIVNGTAPFLAQPRMLQTIDEIEVRRIIGRLVQFPRKRNTDPVAAWMEALSVIRLGLRRPEDVEAMYGGDVDGLADVWPLYRRELRNRGVLDFDEQIY